MPPSARADGPEQGEPMREPRWPIALAISAFIVLTVVMRIAVPRRESIGPHWVVPAIEVVLLVALLAAHPADTRARARWMRRVMLTLIGLLAATGLSSTIILIFELVTGSELTQSADSLLASGTVVWVGNGLVFGLLYWQLDSGGPLARLHGLRPYRDFAFTQHMSPELAPPGWEPHYVDYFVLGFTTSTAFSPTDVMPLAPWAKLTMAVQSLISLTVVGLVIARAVNAFT